MGLVIQGEMLAEQTQQSTADTFELYLYYGLLDLKSTSI